MQEYLQRSRFGEVMDALGGRILLFFLCLGWFILLWGLRLSALAAGISLFVLFMLIEKKTRDARLARREKSCACAWEASFFWKSCSWSRLPGRILNPPPFFPPLIPLH